MVFRSGLGTVLTRAPESITNAGVPIFTITGGCILVTYIIGRVVGVALDGTATSLSVQFDDGVGAATPMCAALVVTSDGIGTFYIMTGQAADPMRKLETGAALAGPGGMGGGVVAGLGVLGKGYVCGAGDIERLGTAVDAGTVGWTLCYVPLEEGVAVVVA